MAFSPIKSPNLTVSPYCEVRAKSGAPSPTLTLPALLVLTRAVSPFFATMSGRGGAFLDRELYLDWDRGVACGLRAQQAFLATVRGIPRYGRPVAVRPDLEYLFLRLCRHSHIVTTPAAWSASNTMLPGEWSFGRPLCLVRRVD